MERVVDRSMARVEQMRGRPYKKEVPVRFYTREEFASSDEIIFGEEIQEPGRAYENQFWKSVFMVGDTKDAAKVQKQVALNQVNGYYNPSNEELVIVAKKTNDGRFRVDEKLLIHELGHVMQDQYEGLWTDELAYRHHDEQLAKLMVVEGEALSLEDEFQDRCEIQWSCLNSTPAPNATSTQLNQGVVYTDYYPYATGEQLIADQGSTSRWENIETLMEDPPEQTRQHLSGEETLDKSVHLYGTDTSNDDWMLFEDYGWDGRDSIGQATLFTMLWYQNTTYGVDSVGRNAIQADYGYTVEEYNYRDQLSQALITDTILYYHDQEYDESAYVWKSIWDSEQSAAEFSDVYMRILQTHNGEEVPVENVVTETEYQTITAESDQARAFYLDDADFGGYYLLIRDENGVLITQGDFQAHITQVRDFSDEPLFQENYSPDSILDQTDSQDQTQQTQQADQDEEKSGTGIITRTRLSIGVTIIGVSFYMLYMIYSSNSGRKTIRDRK